MGGLILTATPLSVVYHQTEVVRCTPDTLTVNTGGWFTATTRTRINQTANQFGLNFGVSQKKGEWFLHHGEQVTPFNGADSVTVKREGF